MANSIDEAGDVWRKWRDEMDVPCDNGYIVDYSGRSGTNQILECVPDEIHEIDMSKAYIIGCRRS